MVIKEKSMYTLKPLAVLALTAALLTPTHAAPAQISVGVNIGPAPICPYGYFDYAP